MAAVVIDDAQPCPVRCQYFAFSIRSGRIQWPIFMPPTPRVGPARLLLTKAGVSSISRSNTGTL